MKFFRASFLSLSLSLVLLLPSVALAQQPPAELRQTSARLAGEVLVNGRAMEYMQNLSDKFGGRLSGSPAYGRAAEWAAEQFRAAGIKDVQLEPFQLESTWTRGVSPELSFDTDHGHFLLAGIPALDLWVDMTHYNDVHHKSSDTVDKVVAHNLVAGAGIVAITAHALAERPERIAPQIKHDAVGELLKKANLEEFLKTVGVWK